MARSIKILLLTLAILTLAVVILVVLVKTLVTTDKVRQTLLPLAEQRLGRKVTLGDIEIGLFTGVSLKDLQVRSKDGAEDFIALKSLDLHYQLLPLLTGKVIIDQVKLEQPKILVIRNPDGSFNFSDFLGRSAAGPKHVAPTKLKSAEKSSPGSPMNLLVSDVSIADGEVLFIDRYLSSETPFRYTLNQLSLQARKITFDQPFPIGLTAALDGAKISMSGSYDLARQRGAVALNLDPLDLIQFAPYYREVLPGRLGSGKLSLNIETDFSPLEVTSKGKLILNKVDLLPKGHPEAELKNAALKIDYALRYQFDKQQLSITNMLVNFNDIVIGLEGDLALAGKEPDLSVALLLDRFDLRTLAQSLPAGLGKAIQSYGLAGQVNGRVELAGVPSSGSKLLKKASLQLNDVQGSLASLRAGVSGSVDYAAQQLKGEKLKLVFGDQQANLSFNASNLLGKPINGDFQLSGDTLDLNKLLPPSSGSTTPSAPTGINGNSTGLPTEQTKKEIAGEVGPFDIPVIMHGTLAVNKLLYKQLTLDQVQADLLLKNNHLQITHLRTGVGGGEVSGNSDINLGVKGLSYRGQLNLTQSKLATLVAGLFPDAGQSISGLLQSKNNFSGKGTIPENLLNSLQVKGSLLLQKGQVTGSPLLEQLSTFLGDPELKVLSFESLQSQYDLQDGKTKLSGDLISSTVKLSPEGTVGLNGQLNLGLGLRLAPQLLSRLKSKEIAQLITTDDKGWGILPLKIKGTLSDPKIAYDTDKLRKQTVDKAEKRLEKQLLKKIAPKGEKEAPAKQLLDGTLKKLFGN